MGFTGFVSGLWPSGRQDMRCDLCGSRGRCLILGGALMEM